MCVGEGVGCLLFIFLTHQKRKSQNKMKIIKLTTGPNLMLEDVELRLFYVPALCYKLETSIVSRPFWILILVRI